ncbi:MAG: type II secretion system protein GspN [Deltaproteobacteria bacterium]|nr:type II secretion system protein GspN [Deltaproteobacteria bacterium]
MMAWQRLLRLAGLIAAGVALFLFFTYLLFPTARIDAVINRLLATQGLSLSPGASKTILPGLAWNNLLLSSDQGALLSCDLLKVRLGLLPLLTGRVALGAAAAIGTGRLELEYGLTGSKALELHAQGISLAEIPFFKTVLGARAGGALWSEGVLTRAPKGVNGELKLEVKQLEFAGVKLGGFPLPDAANLRSQGMVRVTNGAARLESFTLEGEGIYMRLSGDLPSGASAATTPLNLALEIMPKAEFLERQKLVFMLLAKFTVSPGVYKVPIRGTLLKPEIM